MHHKVIFLLFFTMVSTLPLWGQNISGKIVDDSNTPIEYASVICVSLSDTTKVITSTYSKDDGIFILDCSSHKNETLRLKISSVGFHAFQIDVPSDYVFENAIVLKENAIALQDVTVSAYKRAITLAEGKLGIDVGKLTLGITDNVMDVLKRTPGIVISPEGIKVQGNDPLVVIDGVKQRMPMSTLLNYLKSLVSR